MAAEFERDEVILLVVARPPGQMPCAICRRFSASAYSRGGRTVRVHPRTQIVVEIFVWVTWGLMAPGGGE